MKACKFSTLILFIVAITFIPDRSSAATITTMDDLVNGDSLQLGSLLFSDWSVSNSSFDLSKLTMGNNSPSNAPLTETMFMTPTERILRATTGQVRSISFDFKATDLSELITSIKGDLRFRFVDGFAFNSPSLRLDTLVGTTQGGSDLGTSFEFFSLNSDIDSQLIDFSERSSVWVRTTYTLRGNSGLAEGGFLSALGLGSAFQTTFFQSETTSPPTVPEPSTLVLLGLGIVGLGVRRRWVHRGLAVL